jgi:SAM-dependent methyltransferase
MELGVLSDKLRTAREMAGLAIARRRDPRLQPWPVTHTRWEAICNICGWHGDSFVGEFHSESAVCTVCGSVARDRFVYHCFTSLTPPVRNGPPPRLLETSPRLGAEYRDVMAQRFDYLCSDFDLRAHQANIQIDLQAIDLPDRHLDVVLTAHVLEHVPEYKAALAEIHRVLRPGGVLYLNIPVVAATTSVPTEPEYHGDDTLVHWRFGFDIADELRAAGFDTSTLVPQELCLRIADRDVAWARANPSDAHDPEDIVSRVDPATLTDVAGWSLSRRLGFLPSYMFVVFRGERPR